MLFFSNPFQALVKVDSVRHNGILVFILEIFFERPVLTIRSKGMSSDSDDSPAGSDGGSDRNQAINSVKGPAISLMVLGGMSAMWHSVSVVLNIFGLGGGMLIGDKSGQYPQLMLQGGLGIVVGAIGLACAIVIILGAIKMMKLESYGFAMASAIIAMVPCLWPCCCLGLPIGIWALVVLCSAEVKSSFR